MGKNVVTDTYSTAIFELAVSEDNLLAMEADLMYVKDTLSTYPALRNLLIHPVMETAGKLDLVQKIFGQAIQKMALHFLCVMIKRSRARYIEGAIEEFISKSREHRGIAEATVTVAAPISESEIDDVAKKLQALTGKEYICHVKVDPAIIGGMIVQMGDMRIDGSLQGRLDDLKKSLLSDMA